MRSTLEEYVDQGTLGSLIDALAELCHEKAEHVLTNWQDKEMARSWTRDARKLEKISPKIEN
jgi:hypothetical protein